MRALIGGAVYTPTRIIPHGVALWEGERIVAVGSPEQTPIPADCERLDAQGAIVCPGFVDIHVHGGDGADCTDGAPEAVRAVAQRHLRAGTTSILATTSSAPVADVWRACDAIRQVMAEPATGAPHARAAHARILGIHLESNWFTEAQRGAHAAQFLHAPTPEECERALSYGGTLRRVTLAPELEGALEFIRALAARGVLVSGGHSDALYEAVCLAMEAGMRHTTHLWSGMSTVRRIGPKRHAGMVEASLVEDGLTTEIIADGYHLPTSLMRLAVRMKSPERLCLVSDAMRASGLGPGVYDIGGLTAIVEEGYDVAVVADRTAFAGSISTLAQCLRQVVQVVGVSLREGLQMVTETPARILGLEREHSGLPIGRLAPGCLADLLLLDPVTLAPRQVILNGEVVRAG